MRLLAILSSALMCGTPLMASAQTYDPRTVEQGSAERSARAFHGFVNCLGRRYEAISDKVIVDANFDDAFHDLRRVAQESDCGVGTDITYLKADPLLVRGVLAEARFEKSLELESAQPQLIGLPPLISTAELGAIAPGDVTTRRRALMFVFADCTARNATGDIVSLLATSPMSTEEKAAFGALGSTMGACMPAADGTELQFSAPALRSYLALASYYLQREAAGDAPKIIASFAAPESAQAVTQEGQD